MTNIPFPQPSNDVSVGIQSTTQSETPWVRLKPNEMPPMMFRIEFYDGRTASYAYSDLREVRSRDAGYMQLFVYGMEKYCITLEGRHLNDLRDLLQNGRVKSLAELGPRTFDHPEEKPAIDKITVEALTGPSC